MPTKTATKLLPLTIEEYARERYLPVDYLRKTWDLKNSTHLGVRCIEQPYTKIDGTVGSPRFRFANSKRSPEGAKLILYGQKQLIPEVVSSTGKRFSPGHCFLVEGESDTQTLQFLRYNVLGIPGTQTWETCIENDPDIFDFLFTRELIAVIQEPPSPRELKKHLDTPAKMVATIRESLGGVQVLAVRLWEFAPKDENGDPEYKDISGMWTYYGGEPGHQRFTKALRSAVMSAAKQTSIPQRKLDLICAADEEPELTPWLWDKRIVAHRLCVFSGMADRGKSTVATDFIARLTTGSDFTDCKNTTEPCDVAILAGEDDRKQDLLPRLIAAGADRARVHFVEKSTCDGADPWTIALDRDLDLFRVMLAGHPNIKLLVVDPVTSYIGEVDPNSPKEVRPFLDKLRNFAMETNVTILLIMHFSKNLNVSSLHRSGGAATWTDAPRSVWLFDKKKDELDTADPRTYVMVSGKGNKVANADKKTLEYHLVTKMVKIQGTDSPVGAVEWGEQTDLTMDQQFAVQQHDDDGERRGPEPVKTTEAIAFINAFLADGAQLGTEVIAQGKAAGHSQDTLGKASRLIEVKKTKRLGVSWWELPPDMVEPPTEG